jgi:manganese transport protein
MLAEAVELAKNYSADLVLLHVVEGVGGQWYGESTADLESREDHAYLRSLAERLRRDNEGQGIGRIHVALGYGDVTRELVRLAKQENIDFLVVGGHGHRGVSDLVHGDTISGVRHDLKIPVLAIRKLPEESQD